MNRSEINQATQQINQAMQIIFDRLAEIDKLVGPAPDSFFQGARSAYRALEDELEDLFHVIDYEVISD